MAWSWTINNVKEYIELLESGRYEHPVEALNELARRRDLPRPHRGSAGKAVHNHTGKHPSEIIVKRSGATNQPSFVGEENNSQIPTDKASYLHDSIEKEYQDNKGKVISKGLSIKTLEQALEVAEVDLSVWQVERHVINSWEATGKDKSGTFGTYTNWQIKVWLERKTAQESSLEKLLEEISFNAPKPAKLIHNTKPSGRMLEISIVDPHIGLRCRKPSSSHDWDPSIARKTILDISADLVKSSEGCGPFDLIVVPIGHDWSHVDNLQGMTTKGTLQPEAIDYFEMYLAVEKLAIEWILSLREIAPVEVITVPGNHDHVTSFTIGRLLAAYFRNDDRVNVDSGQDTASLYKKVRWGTNLIGLTHKAKDQRHLAAMMANMWPDDWAQTTWREFHLGDQHRASAARPTVWAEQGVGIEFLPSIVPSNSWAMQNGYNFQIRSATAHVWDKESGQVARFIRMARENDLFGKVKK